MKKRLLLFNMLLITAALIIYSAITLLSVEERYLREARSYMNGMIDIVMSYDIAPEDYDNVAKEKAAAFGNGVRITIIDSEGNVLGDSEVDYRTMPSHLYREEVQEALVDGYGDEIRTSNTTGKRMLYMTKQYDGGIIARFSMPLDNSRMFLIDTLKAAITAAVLAIIGSLAAASFVTSRVLKPFWSLKRLMPQVLGGEVSNIPEPAYDELKPVVKGLNDMAARVEEYVNSLKQQTEKINNIIRYMQEGIIMLDGEAKVLLSNDAARTLLSIEGDLIGKDITHIARHKDIITAAKKAVSGGEASVVDYRNRMTGAYLRIFISPVQKSPGAIMFLSDVTLIIESDNMRREFTANVSHELKTPLTTIKGFAELLSEGMVQDAQTRERYIMLIRLEADRLLNLINDLMRISQLEENAVPGLLESVDLMEVAQSSLKSAEKEARRRGITLAVSGHSAKVRASRAIIKQLLTNLIDNAVKYNREGGIVSVIISKGDGRASIAVEDTGIGIAKEDIPRIFERFYRVDKGRSKKTGGTGLGLSIVKHIAGLYGGEVSVESRQGKGTKFLVVFPEEDK
ncbi:MAG: ATP-binding protein [Christensenellales bacterium]|jgi:two-component system phosphate regulon sensor histidine kinase PhoR